jgi:hypothetical protein
MRGRGRGLATGGAPPTGVLRRVPCCCEPGLRAVGVLLQVVVGAGAGRPHPCAPWPWPRRPVGFACRRSAPQTLSHVRVSAGVCVRVTQPAAPQRALAGTSLSGCQCAGDAPRVRRASGRFVEHLEGEGSCAGWEGKRAASQTWALSPAVR